MRADTPGIGRASPAHPGLGPSPPSPREQAETSPLPQTFRTRLEAITGFDLGGIQIATGTAVERTADVLHARAYTQYGRIHLGSRASLGDFDLIAHEVAHALQQTLPEPQLARLGLTPAPAETVLRFPFRTPAMEARARARGALSDPFALPLFYVPKSLRDALAWSGDEGLEIRMAKATRDALDGSLRALRQLEGWWAVAQRQADAFPLRKQRWELTSGLAANTDDPSVAAAMQNVAQDLAGFVGRRWTELQQLMLYSAAVAEAGTRRWGGGLDSLDPHTSKRLGALRAGVSALFDQFDESSWPVEALRTALGCPSHVRDHEAVIDWIVGLHLNADATIQSLAGPAMGVTSSRILIDTLGTITGQLGGAQALRTDLAAVARILGDPDGVIAQRSELRAILLRVRPQLTECAAAVANFAEVPGVVLGGLCLDFQNWGRAAALGYFAGEFRWMISVPAAVETWAREHEPEAFDLVGGALLGIDRWSGLAIETTTETDDLEEEYSPFSTGWRRFLDALVLLGQSTKRIGQRLLKRIPFLARLAKEVPALWNRAQGLFERLKEQVLKTRTVVGPLWEFFLGVLGLELPMEFVSDVANRAGSLLGKILRHAFRFLGNLAKAISTGLHRFASRLGEHLLTGLLEWLFGEFGIDPPITFGRIADALLKNLGLTASYFCERIAVHLRSRGHEVTGPEVEDRLRKAIKLGATAIRWIKLLLDGDYAGFWQELRHHLSEFWRWLVNQATTFVVDTLKRQLVRWLAKLLDPTGISQILSVIKAIYEAIKTMIQQIEKMWAIVRSVFGAIREIADGQTERAAQFVENAAIRGLGVVIAFGANYFGLGSIVEPIQKGLAKGKELVTKAMDGVIRMASAVWDWLVAQAKKALEWWKNRHRFTDKTGGTGELYYETNATEAVLHVLIQPARGQVHVAATPLALEKYLGTLKQKATTARERQLVKEIEEFAEGINVIKRESDGSFSAARGELIHVCFNEIVLRLNEMSGKVVVPPATVVEWQARNIYGDAHGSRMVAHPLSIDSGGHVGSKPVSGSTKLWDKVRTLKRGNDTAYVKGHLLNHHLHGPGTWKNMIPLARTTNSDMERLAEDTVKKAVIGENRIVHYEVQMDFDPPPSRGTAAERTLPSAIVMEAYELEYDGRKWKPNGNVILPRKPLKHRVAEPL